MAPRSPVAVLAVLLLAAGPVAAQVAPGAAQPVQAAAQVLADPANGGYQIGTDDTLDISVFQVPELSRTVQVDRNGEFILPIVGRVPAAGKTSDELAAFLTQKLQGRYLKDPLITVVVKAAAKNRVTVDGAVIKPGVYPLSGPTTLMQAVALANGPDPRVANIRRVTIVRAADGRRGAQTYDLTRIRDGKAADPTVNADDIVIVEASGARSFFTYYGSILTTLALLRPY
jgi:polysaccharide export outer membrane protein